MENVIRFHDGGQGLFPFKLQPAVQFLFNSLLKMDPQGLLPGLADGVGGSRGRVHTPSILEEAVVTRCPVAGQNSPATNGLAHLGEFDRLVVAHLVFICRSVAPRRVNTGRVQVEGRIRGVVSPYHVESRGILDLNPLDSPCARGESSHRTRPPGYRPRMCELRWAHRPLPLRRARSLRARRRMGSLRSGVPRWQCDSQTSCLRSPFRREIVKGALTRVPAPVRAGRAAFLQCIRPQFLQKSSSFLKNPFPALTFLVVRLLAIISFTCPVDAQLRRRACRTRRGALGHSWPGCSVQLQVAALRPPLQELTAYRRARANRKLRSPTRARILVDPFRAMN